MRRFVVFILIAIAAVLLLAGEPALAQCPMCRQSLEGSGDAAIARSLNLAILVLLVPPLALFVGIFGLFYRYRNVQGQGYAPGARKE